MTRRHLGKLLSTLLLFLTVLLHPGFTTQAAADYETPRRALKRLKPLSREDLEQDAGDIFLKLATGTLSAAADKELDLLMTIAGGAFTPLDMMKLCLTSNPDALEALYEAPDVVSKILEELPLLTALPAFKAAAESTSDYDLIENFRQGMTDMYDLMEQSHKINAEGVAASAAKILDVEDEGVQELVALAQKGDLSAVQELRDRIHKDLLPELNLQGFRDSILHTHPSRLAQVDEAMHYLDQDAYTSDLIRNFPQKPEDVLKMI